MEHVLYLILYILIVAARYNVNLNIIPCIEEVYVQYTEYIVHIKYNYAWIYNNQPDRKTDTVQLYNIGNRLRPIMPA